MSGILQGLLASLAGEDKFELYVWGYNNHGQVGDGTVVSKSSPVQIGALTNWAQVSAGDVHCGAVKTDGTLWTWGRNSYNGALGLGDTVSRSSPVQVGALTNWAQVSAGINGFAHTACVKTDGTLWTWGTGQLGRLGLGNVSNQSSPVQVGALTNWIQVSAGSNHTAAITTGGELYAWGSSGSGKLGDGTVDSKSSPIQIGALTNWAQVSLNYQSAAVKTDGTLWAWGNNGFGRLGDGTVVSKSSPVQIGALTNWAQVSMGSGLCAAVKTDSTLWTWGSSAGGALGTNSAVDKSSPVQVGLLTNWSQSSAGNSWMMCTQTDGTLWSWGSATNGRTGLNLPAGGNTGFRSSPVQVGALTNWLNPSAGSKHGAALFKI